MEVVDPVPHFGSLQKEPRTLKEPEEPWRNLEDQSGTDGEKWELVDAVLSGGAPWGFTLRGGLEYQEPLIITKVEDGSRAAAAELQVGDEIVSINSFPLSGYRQEAICLVKSSYRTLTLGLKRKMKMVDIVTQTMPADSDIHVARSFLTKILRSSMRRNRFKGRNEPFCRPHSWHSSKVSENPSEVCKSDTNAELAPIWQTKYGASSPSANDFTNCWGQPSLRQVSCKFSSVGNMESLESSITKTQVSADQSLALKGQCKHDSKHIPPEPNSSRSGITPTNCMFYRGSPSERHRYLQIPVSNGGGRISPRIEDQTSSRFSSSGRLNLNPVWHVPEKSSTTNSPPPPPPPLRSDSFAATKVHEKGLVIPYPHGPPPYSHQKSHGKGADRHFGEYPTKDRTPESRISYSATSKKDVLHVYLSPEDYNPNQLNPNKPFSLSSSDVRQGQSPFACQPQHQRQRSDEGPSYLHPRNTSAPKTQTVGTYYRSLQHLPTNAGAQNKTRSSTASPSCAAPENSHDGMAHFRYYCITAQQPTKEASEGTVVEDGWRPELVSALSAVGSSDWNSQKVLKTKQSSPYLQVSENKNSNYEFCKQNALDVPSPGLVPMMGKSISAEKEKEILWKKDAGIAENHPNKHLQNHQTDQRNCAQRNFPKDPWISKSEYKICPQRTPLLHSLAQESKFLANNNMVTANGGTYQEAPDPSSGKQGRRSDRYATTLRNEIQEKRAQLQKSRSAAALSCSGETDEDAGVWKSTETSTSSSDGSFTNTYKDHLKEAQARVLQATSFKRKDLELPGNEAFPGQSSQKADSTCVQVSRIGCRKRFPIDKRVHSFSEPDKINEVGVEEKSPHQISFGSFVDRCKFFEGASRPTFSKPVPKKSSLSPSEDVNGGKNKLASFVGENDRKFFSKQQSEEQQRLGTFAEYEATWNLQKKTTEARTTSRYRSAENILDSGAEERNSSVCIHERSRSSPSADFYGGVNLQTENSMVESHPESKGDQHELHIDSMHEEGHCQLNISKPLDLSPGSDPELKDTPTLLHSTHITQAPSLISPYPHHLHLLQDSGLQLVPPPRQPETTCPSNSLEELPSLGHSLEKDPHPAGVPRLENEKPFCTVALLADPPAAPAVFPAAAPPAVPPAAPPAVPPAVPPAIHPAAPPVAPTVIPPADPPAAPTGVPPPTVPPADPPADPPEVPKAVAPPAVPPADPPADPLADHLADPPEDHLADPPAVPLPAVPAADPLPVDPPAVPPADPLADPPADHLADPPAVPPPAVPPAVPKAVPPPAVPPADPLADPPSVPPAAPTENPPAVPPADHPADPLPVVPPPAAPPEDPYSSSPHRSAEVTVLSECSLQKLTDENLPSMQQHEDLFSNMMENSESSKFEKNAPTERNSETEFRQFLAQREVPGGPDGTANHQLFFRPCSPELSNPDHGSPESPEVQNVPENSSEHSEEDEKREELAKDIMGKDKSLVDILDQSKMKTTMDLMEGIYPQGEQILEGAQQRKKSGPKQTSPKSAQERRVDENLGAPVSLVTSSSYYSTSAPKAELLIKMKDMQDQMKEQDSEDDLETDLSSKKQELIDSLSKKLQVLREARESLQEDVQDNNILGEEVEATVQSVCRPNELDKFRMFVGDLDKVVSLLLSLSGRLARVENALNNLEEAASPEEKRTLVEKRKLLIRQHEDAKELKENLDRRERLVYEILASHLNKESLADYQHFVKMKSALIIEQRKLEDRIKLGEEQLKCLKDSLPLEQRLRY